MSSFLATASDGLIGSLITGVFGWGALWLTGRRRQTRLQDAWQQQANELDERLTKQYGEQIAYFRRSLERCQTEQLRLQKLVGRLQTRGRDD